MNESRSCSKTSTSAKIEVHLAYEKNELQPEEVNWLRALSYIRTSFCRNLHAKCYRNEQFCIVSSLNLHEFSHAKNNEIGVPTAARRKMP